MNGGLRLACNPARLIEIKRQATTARSFGLEMHVLTPQEARDLWPLMDVSDVLGAAFLPSDGQANPSDIGRALAKGAKDNGVQIFENVEVKGIRVQKGRVCGVDTANGSIESEIVVNCAGQWSRNVGALAGVNVPLVSMQHQYLITEAIDGVTSDLPTLRDPDRLTYYKEEVGGLVMGGYEPNPIGWAEDGFPENFAFTLLDSNWDHFEQILSLALPRVPALENAGIKTLLNGPEALHPTGTILGESPEVDGFLSGRVCFRNCISGRRRAGTCGNGSRAANPLMTFGRSTSGDLENRIRISVGYENEPTRCTENTTPSRGQMKNTARATVSAVSNIRCGKSRPGLFWWKLGWEDRIGLPRPGSDFGDEYSFEAPNWLTHSAVEHQAAREAVALFDQSSFAKFLLRGPDSVKALDWICANRIDRPVGSVIYTQLLNKRGGIESDLTVTRIDDDAFYLVTGTGFIRTTFTGLTDTSRKI